MTPEERAERVMAGTGAVDLPADANTDGVCCDCVRAELAAAVATAIREAVAEERARYEGALLDAHAALDSVYGDEEARRHGLFQGAMLPRVMKRIEAALGRPLTSPGAGPVAPSSGTAPRTRT